MQRQAYCAVTGYVNPTNNFGMYLPVDDWNGRYLVRGCGGSCGSVVTELACGPHLRDGYACLITDMGHSSTLVDNNWVANNLQGLVDFGYRSTHVTSVAGKAIATAFYARAPVKSYFFACSTGGRQGMIEAERFPEDFDGIVAIAPASMGAIWPEAPRHRLRRRLLQLTAGRVADPARAQGGADPRRSDPRLRRQGRQARRHHRRSGRLWLAA